MRVTKPYDYAHKHVNEDAVGCVILLFVFLWSAYACALLTSYSSHPPLHSLPQLFQTQPPPSCRRSQVLWTRNRHNRNLCAHTHGCHVVTHSAASRHRHLHSATAVSPIGHVTIAVWRCCCSVAAVAVVVVVAMVCLR